MIRHIALFTWAEDTTEEQKAAMAAELGKLPGLIPQLRSYAFGPNAAIDQGNYDYAVVADVDSADDYIAYRDNPDHQAVIAQYIKPIIAGRVAIQLSL